MTPTLLQQDPGAQAATVSPAVNIGDKLTTTINTVAIPYTVAPNDTPQKVATAIAAAINANSMLKDPVSGAPLNQRFHAVGKEAQVVITAGFALQWAVSGPGTGSVTPAAVTDPTVQSATVGGTPAAGELFSITIDTTPIVYVAQQADTPDTVAAALATAINATTVPHVYSGLPLNTLLAASAAGATITVQTADAGPPFDLTCAIMLANAGSYTAGAPVPAEAIITLSGSTTAQDVVTFLLNGVAVTYRVAATDSSLPILAGSLANALNIAVQPDPTTKLPFSELLHAVSNASTLTITAIDPSTAFTVTVSSNGSEQFAVAGPNPASQSAAVAGPFPPGAVLTTTINGADLLYTVVAADTANSIASNIAALITGPPSVVDPNTGASLNTLLSASVAGSTITVTAANATTPFTLAVSASQGTYTAGRLTPPFADNGFGVYLSDSTQTLFGHQPALCAACNLTGAEFALIAAALDFDATTALTLAQVSALFRYGWLAHALGLSVLEFLALRRFSGIDPFAPLDPSTVAPAEPPAIRFLRLVQAMENADLAAIQALYLIWNQDVSGVLAPVFDSVAGLAQTLCTDFAAVESQFALQDDPTGSIAQQLMALVYGSSDTDFFFGLLNQSFSVSIPYSYASPVLPQSVLDASSGLLAYNDTAKSLSVSGLLTNAGEAAIAAAAAVSTTDNTDNLAAGLVTITPTSMTNIAAGAALIIDSGPSQETVVVASTTATSFTTTTAQAHNGTAIAFPIVSVPSLPAALTALATASQQAVAPFFAKYPELQSLYSVYVSSTLPEQTRRENLLASFLPTLIQLRKVEQSLSAITAQIGCDPSFAAALLQDAVILHSEADPTQPAVADLIAIGAGGLTAELYLGNDPTKPPDQTIPAVGPVLYVQTATLGGTPAVGVTLTTTINGQAVTYKTTVVDGSVGVIAQDVAAAVNVCTTVDPISGLPINKLVTASASGATVVLTPSQPLTSTGVFTLSCASSMAGLTYTPGSQLPAGKGPGGIAGSWSGYITPPQTGSYDICVVAGPSAQVTLEINGQAMPMAATAGVWSNQSEISLTVGQFTAITLNVTSVETTLALGWRSPPGLGWTPIPTTALFPAGPMQNLGATYSRFLKAVSLATALSLSADEIAWLGTDPTQVTETTSASVTVPGPATFTPASVANIEVGSSLVIDTGPAQETVTVTSLTATTFTATTTQAHNGAAAAFPIVSNPQPILNLGWLNLLPGIPDVDPVNDPSPDLATAAKLTLVLSGVLDFARVKQALSPSDERLLHVLQNPTALLPNGQSAMISLTGWAQLSINALCAQFFGATPPATALSRVENFCRVYDAMTLVQTCRLTAPALLSAVTNAPTPTTVSSLQSALRACYAASDWLTVIQPINDALRMSQRDALVAYILQRLSANPGNTITTADDLYAWFLIDPSTEPAVQTSRIRLALSAVQLFIERILRALETEPPQPVSPGDIDPQQWAWMKRYRVWQANREVFLWPENWLYPQLRDDQSPIFQQMMSTLLQSDITDDAATSAYLDYLSDLADVAKLEPCGIYYVPATADTDEATYVVARTFGAHRTYYFRQFQGESWSPWTKVPIDCEDMPITPIVWNGRLFLFWLKTHKLSPFTPAQATAQPGGTNAESPVTSLNLGQLLSAGPQTAITQVTVQATLWWSEFYNGEWQPARSSDPNRPTTIGVFDPYGPNTFEAYRNQMALKQVQCTGAFWSSDYSPPVGLPPIPSGSLLLAISTPLNPFPREPGTAGGSGFLLHNTHSAPIPFEDLPVSGGDIGGDIGAYLDLPTPGRQIQPPNTPYQQPAAPYTGGPDSNWLGINYTQTPDELNLLADSWLQLLEYFWTPRIIEVQPGLPEAWYAPFIYEDRRNIFYVTTTPNQLTFYRTTGFGIGLTAVGQAQKSLQIPNLAVAPASSGSRITFRLPGTIPVTYQGTQILSSGGRPAPAVPVNQTAPR